MTGGIVGGFPFWAPIGPRVWFSTPHGNSTLSEEFPLSVGRQARSERTTGTDRGRRQGKSEKEDVR